MASNEYSVGDAVNLFDLAVEHRPTLNLNPGAINLAPYKQIVRVRFESELAVQTTQMLLAVAGADAPVCALKDIKAEVIDQAGRTCRKPWWTWLHGASAVSLTPTPPSRRKS